jgi:hypothetical protein
MQLIENGIYKLPDFIKKSEEKLNRNKDQMVKLMKNSVTALSQKISTFKITYSQNYLEDKTRLHNCQETLEEITSRAAAVSEFKKKVDLFEDC